MDNKTPFFLGEETELEMQDWLLEQVNAAFKKLDNGKAKFISHDQAKSDMAKRKTRIRSGE